MPGRDIPLVNGEIYHVLNRGIASQPTFTDAREYKRAIEAMSYYQNLHPPQRYSIFLVQARKIREEILAKLKEKAEFWVEIIAYCFMPNHFHFLLRQKADRGISNFLSNFTNSYTRYFNTRHKRQGPLFMGKFKAVRVETDEQFYHLSRYIHLNPYSSYVVKSLETLANYPFSSLPEYLGEVSHTYCQKELILARFPTAESYKKFVFDQADYQRSLEIGKHLWLET
ncbi:transposase [Candidatus Gottesmanbacteria bacterium]|nr:transposase [Candidatus Gottesmanbacteria bacterium]